MHVAFINMPFAPVNRPSIQIGILKSILTQLDVESDVFHFNVDFAKTIGFDAYLELISARKTKIMIGEWLFARKLWPKRQKPDEAYYQMLPYPDEYQAMREVAEQFINSLARKIDWDKYNIIAFPCGASQTISALCLSRIIKTRYPNVTTIYGGVSFFEEAAIEFMKKLDWLDYVFVGEAETSFSEFICRLKENQEIDGIAGIAYRKNGQIKFKRDHKPGNLLISPSPDYSDFFRKMQKNASFFRHFKIELPYEASRGCWYGEKQKCTFCSLNHHGIHFRSKDSKTVYHDVTGLWRQWKKHNVARIYFVDNIMDKEYLHSLLPKMFNAQIPLFFEVKPDLYARDIEILKKARVKTIQAGIENFDPRFICVQNKGQSVLSSIFLLKWCKHLGIHVIHNLLITVPFEAATWYQKQLDTLRKIVHLGLPRVFGISIGRFGAYYQKNLLPNLKPSFAYAHVYPSFIDLKKIAYNFSYDPSGIIAPPKTFEPTIRFVRHRRNNQPVSLRFVSDECILDNREKQAIKHKITQTARDVLKFCTEPQPISLLSKRFAKDAEILADLERKGLLISMEGRALSLVEPESIDLKYCSHTGHKSRNQISTHSFKHLGQKERTQCPPL